MNILLLWETLTFASIILNLLVMDWIDSIVFI